MRLPKADDQGRIAENSGKPIVGDRGMTRWGFGIKAWPTITAIHGYAPMLCRCSVLLAILASLLMPSVAQAEWKAASPAVAAAAKEPAIAAVLAAVDQMDRSLIDDEPARFAALLAGDLVVNNPQNGISPPGATAQLNASGRISYASYRRTIEYAGIRNGMVVLMGEELVVPKSPNPMVGQTVRRRFTDVWRYDEGGWRLALRQATIIPADRGP